MLPILLTIGKIPISSFGLFLALAFLLATFLVWRLARAWDLNEEKVLDLILLTFFGSLVGARIFFISLNFSFFAVDLSRIFLLTNYPGLSFWGGLLGGWLTLTYFARRFKIDFLQVADLAAIGLLGGLILGDLGCFLGGCGVGIPSRFLGVDMVGAVGKRFPIQLIESAIFLLILLNFWSKALKFHFPGKILSMTLISVGLVKLVTNFLKVGGIENPILSLVVVILGIFIYYRASRKNFRKDVESLATSLIGVVTDSKIRSQTLVTLNKNWYNQKVKLLSFNMELKKLPRRLRVRPTPKNF